MTQDKPHTGDEKPPTPEELRKQVESSREDLGDTVEALAAKADVKNRTKEKTAALKQQVAERATQVTTQLQDKAAHATHVVHDKTPEPVRAKAAAASERVRVQAKHAGELAREKAPEPVREKADQGMRMARANRAPLLAGVGVVIALLLARKARRHRR
ncbi:DUF3618 domain-containing protein [Streptomyces sp. NPDC000983]|uniref:DUF3618 domain-containing protein n=1 Tax=Streptomyces sp. NPDC000983 TaxID=3154373 RepID=UPI00332F3AD0